MIKERSDAQKMGYYKAQLRSLWRRSPMYWAAWRAARVRAGILKCVQCGREDNAKLFEMDHINPVVDPEVGDEGISTWVYRLHCHESGLQALCDVCHKAKTANEHRRRHKNGTGPFTPELLANKCDPIVAVHLVTGETRTFKSHREAAQELGFNEGSVSHVVQGTRNSLNGYTFQSIGTRQKRVTKAVSEGTNEKNSSL